MLASSIAPITAPMLYTVMRGVGPRSLVEVVGPRTLVFPGPFVGDKFNSPGFQCFGGRTSQIVHVPAMTEHAVKYSDAPERAEPVEHFAR